ncbi:MAG: Clp protease ClpP [Proteobacteria bacterium]|nr:Clp protease ClpP [Pseudomonadota bacterium]
MTLLVGGELLLFGDVGDPWGWGDGFTPLQVAEALVEHGPGDITVRINSGGGVASDGTAIYSLLLAHRGVVTTIVEGVAASAASLILMAGDERRMRPGSMLMIHDTSRITWGNADEHRKSADFLDKLSGQYANIYASASGLDATEVREMMKAETWFSAEEARAKGFITVLDTAAASAAASFDYTLYAHAPASMPRRTRPPAATGKAAKCEDKPMTKPWVDSFFAAAEKSALPLAKLNAIVAESGTLEAAQAKLITAQATPADPAEPLTNPAVSAQVEDKAWAGDFFKIAEKSGQSLAALNTIVGKSKDLASAQGALIDAMAAAAGENKPSPVSKTDPMGKGTVAKGFDAGREKVLAMKGKTAAAEKTAA